MGGHEQPPRRALSEGIREGPGGEVTLELTVDDPVHSGRGRLTVLLLAWLPGDPLAVRLELSAQPDHPALPRGSWVVLRDFLRYGLEEPTGDGSVRIAPDAERDRVVFALSRYGRPAQVSVGRDRVAAFLERTERHVPSGAERSDQAIEDLLQRLLAR